MFIPFEVEEFIDGKIEHTSFHELKSRKIGTHTHKLLDSIVMKLTSYDWSDSKNKNIHDSVLDDLIRGIVKITHSSYGCVCMYNNGENTTIAQYTSRKSSKNDAPVEPTMMKHTSPTLFTRSFEMRMCVISNDVSSDPRLGANSFPKNHIPISKYLSIPILTDDGSAGQLILINTSLIEFSKSLIQSVFPLFRVLVNIMQNYNNDIPVEKDLDTLKHHFLATMSHEIRTPLSGIIGMITLLQDAGPLNERQKDYLKRAVGCCMQLMDIITDILDYSKMQSGTLFLNDEPFNVNTCIQDAIDVVTPRLISKKLKIIKSLHSTSQRVYGDHKRLRQVLVNILGNAVKYTSKGTVKITTSSESNNDNDGECIIYFSVQDTGIGIELKDIDSIFNVFSQLEQPNNSSINSGTGLGLAISKELLALMKSTIVVQSDGIGKGSTFSFSIAFQTEMNLSKLLQNNTENLQNAHILVVDDDVNNRMIISGYLHSWELEATVCASASEALHHLRLGKQFTVGIVDICMPHISGIELAQTIRKEFPKLPLIALSSRDVGEHGQVWFDSFLVKPYNKMRLYKDIVEHSTNGRNYSSSSSSSSEEEKTLHNIRICVAEDDETNQFMISEILKTLGVPIHNITITSNGKEAFEECKRKHYDLCLMDLLMPVMDGFESSKKIKKLRKSPSIIVISASILDTDRIKCSKIGVDGFLTKPITKSDLENVLNQFIV